MKTIKIISAISLLFILFSCSITKKLEKSILGKWEITSIKSDKENEFSEEVNKVLNDMISGSYINFKENKSFVFKILNKETKGAWHISEDGKKILSSNKNKFFEIINISENGMTLKSFSNSKQLILDLKKINE